jgi:hypothetical protein
MREPMVGSLIYGDHKIPKKSRPWKERLKLPAAVGLVFVVIAVLIYEFHNYREERAVTQFLGEVFDGHTDQAFSRWDVEGGSYVMEDFLKDWGKDGYYIKGAKSARVIDSNSKGPVVVVYIGTDTPNIPVALRVDKETLKLSYSPTNKYRARASR